MRRAIELLTATAVVAAPIALASPAQAASTTVEIFCDFGPNVRLDPNSITGAVVNDTVVLRFGGGLTTANVTLSGVSGLSTWSSTASTSDRTYTITNSSSASITLTGTSGSCNGRSVTLSISGGSPGQSTSPGSSAPAPIVQQFGMPARGTCDEVQPDGLDWSGVSRGGWGVSWAQWMHGGNGGAVCTRTLVYSTVQSKWTVA